MSLRAYARHRGVDDRSVREAISAGRLRKCVLPSGRISDPALADAEWEATTCSDRRPLTGPAGSMDSAPELADSKARHEAAKAALAEIELAEKQGELLEAKDVEGRLAETISQCKTKLLGIPTRARQQDPTLTAEQVTLFENLVRESLEDLAGPALGEDAK